MTPGWGGVRNHNNLLLSVVLKQINPTDPSTFFKEEIETLYIPLKSKQQLFPEFSVQLHFTISAFPFPNWSSRWLDVTFFQMFCS